VRCSSENGEHVMTLRTVVTTILYLLIDTYFKLYISWSVLTKLSVLGNSYTEPKKSTLPRIEPRTSSLEVYIAPKK
jgi:hypothetical protein